MHPLWIVALLLFSVIGVALCYPVRLLLKANLEAPKVVAANLEIRFFSGLFRLRYRLEVTLLREPYLTVRLYHGEEAPRVLWRLGQQKARTRRMRLPLHEIWRHIRLDRLYISGELGIRDDAFWTVLFAGALCALLQSVMVYACAEKKQSALEVRIAPAFTMDCLRLNLEGIAGCPPIHIIIAIMIWHLKNRKGQKAVWHIQSKTS